MKLTSESELTEAIDVDNAATLVILADMYEATILLAKAKSFIKQNWKQVSLTEDFKSILS
jgi:hypothetical protein